MLDCQWPDTVRQAVANVTAGNGWLVGGDLNAQTIGQAFRRQVTALHEAVVIDQGRGAGHANLAAQRATARDTRAEGLMLKQTASPYHAGRKTGSWWKWKLDPLTVDAVLIYAQAGRGRRANLFTDYTFALWDRRSPDPEHHQLVTFAKAYSGLNDREILDLDRWIRSNTRERFGPTRSVNPELVFEVGFEGIQPSKRHKCGLAVRFPRILRWRRDKPAEEADRLGTAQTLLDITGV